MLASAGRGRGRRFFAKRLSLVIKGYHSFSATPRCGPTCQPHAHDTNLLEIDGRADHIFANMWRVTYFIVAISIFSGSLAGVVKSVPAHTPVAYLLAFLFVCGLLALVWAMVWLNLPTRTQQKLRRRFTRRAPPRENKQPDRYRK